MGAAGCCPTNALKRTLASGSPGTTRSPTADADAVEADRIWRSIEAESPDLVTLYEAGLRRLRRRSSALPTAYASLLALRDARYAALAHVTLDGGELEQVHVEK